MTAGSNIETMDTLVKYTMSREAAGQVKKRFVDMSARGEAISYMDCVLFDAALDVLGEEQEYYGIGDDEWQETLKARRENEKRYKTVRTIDVTDTWKEVLA
jgi:hypothetical protein